MSDHDIEEYCIGCVYYPPNLPPQAYSQEDWLMLQEKICSFDYCVNDENCQQTRKTSCSIVDLNNLPKVNSHSK
jgi:hypothetical protein